MHTGPSAVKFRSICDLFTLINVCIFNSKVLTETSYTRAVDWWGLGVLIFEMLVGEVSSHYRNNIVASCKKGLTTLTFFYFSLVTISRR